MCLKPQNRRRRRTSLNETGFQKETKDEASKKEEPKQEKKTDELEEEELQRYWTKVDKTKSGQMVGLLPKFWNFLKKSNFPSIPIHFG